MDPRLVAQLSIASRPYRRDQSNTTFYSGFQKANYDTDASRAPNWDKGHWPDATVNSLKPMQTCWATCHAAFDTHHHRKNTSCRRTMTINCL